MSAGPDKAGMLYAGSGGAEKIKAKISANENHINIVFFHGGVEWGARPDAATRRLYTELIEAGADLIIGTHPHVVQGFEWIHGKPVFWSIGNYVFNEIYIPHEDTHVPVNWTEGRFGWYTGEEGLFIRLGYCLGKLFYIEPFPIFLDGARTDIVSQDMLDTFYARSRQLRRQ